MLQNIIKMGCTSSTTNKESVEDPTKPEANNGERLIRLDLQMIKSVSTPKNEINLMKLTEELLRALEIILSDDKKYHEFKE